MLTRELVIGRAELMVRDDRSLKLVWVFLCHALIVLRLRPARCVCQHGGEQCAGGQQGECSSGN